MHDLDSPFGGLFYPLGDEQAWRMRIETKEEWALENRAVASREEDQ